MAHTVARVLGFKGSPSLTARPVCVSWAQHLEIARRQRASWALAAVVSTALSAQQYPSRPVRMVVPLSPGGFADTPTRMLAPRLSDQLGRQFFVENKPGAGGTIGADFVAKSPPDGSTLLVTGTPHVISAHLYKKLPYDALKDFTHIALIASGPYALVVNPQKIAVHSVRELHDWLLQHG